MKDLLFQYSIGFLGKEEADDRTVLNDCSHIYLIDGQPIPFEPVLLSATGRTDFADADLFTRSNATGEDSIHFQQLRAYSLATGLLGNLDQFDEGRPVRVAIVGAGFSGLTAALTLLKRGGDRVHVTIFEHHREILPRFAGAHGRRVHPYHHLHFPYDATRATSPSERHWNCSITGGDKHESGGIPDILSWTPGDIEDVLKEVKAQAISSLDRYVAETKAEIRYQTKITDVSPDTDGGASLFWVDYKEVLREVGEGAQSSVEDELRKVDKYNVVIIAPGGTRDSVSLSGQANAEYWSPLRIMNAAPTATHYEVAIIGSGNTAASEVFNFLLHKHNFVELLAALQSWRDDPVIGTSMQAIFAYSYRDPMGPKGINGYLTARAWSAIRRVFNERLVASGQVLSRQMLKVTLLTRSSETLFNEMNPINRFLVHFLQEMGFVRVRDIYKEYGLPQELLATNAYEIAIKDDGVELNARTVKLPITPELETKLWSFVCNCTGTKRSYHKVFRQPNGGTLGAYFKMIGNTSEHSLQSLLDEKQKWITERRKQAKALSEAARQEEVR